MTPLIELNANCLGSDRVPLRKGQVAKVTKKCAADLLGEKRGKIVEGVKPDVELIGGEMKIVYEMDFGDKKKGATETLPDTKASTLISRGYAKRV